MILGITHAQNIVMQFLNCMQS